MKSLRAPPDPAVVAEPPLWPSNGLGTADGGAAPAPIPEETKP
jgi:hypothetical protein